MLVLRLNVWVPYIFAYFLDHVDIISYLPVVNNRVFFARFNNQLFNLCAHSECSDLHRLMYIDIELP